MANIELYNSIFGLKAQLHACAFLYSYFSSFSFPLKQVTPRGEDKFWGRFSKLKDEYLGYKYCISYISAMPDEKKNV